MLKQVRLFRYLIERFERIAEMVICAASRHSAAWGAIQETNLNQIWLIYLFNGILFFADCCRKRTKSYGSALELFNNGQYQFSVNFIKPIGIYLHTIECIGCYFCGNYAFIEDFCD